MRLKDKVVIITGAGQGIGKGLAIRLAKEGCNVVVADINFDNAKSVSEEIINTGRKSIPVKIDVTNSKDVDEMVKKAVDKFKRIDILVNNAGIIKAFAITDMPEEVWDAIINVDLKGTFLCTKAVAKVMVEQKYGKIINISSKSGKKGGLWLSAYCSAKFGVIGLTQSVALDLAPYGINVNAICPGNVFSTPLWDQLDKEYSKKLNIPPAEVRKKYIEKVPLQRECTVDDVANLLVFLASDESNYMSGQAINVTGGQEMR
ncbi:MAG: sorbitol-6-phosphate dehydrogenase [Candidatus Firestonebacteria bacterium]